MKQLRQCMWFAALGVVVTACSSADDGSAMGDVLPTVAPSASSPPVTPTMSDTAANLTPTSATPMPVASAAPSSSGSVDVVTVMPPGSASGTPVTEVVEPPPVAPTAEPTVEGPTAETPAAEAPTEGPPTAETPGDVEVPPGTEETLEPTATCSFEVTATLSDAISTVGIVTFSTDLGTVEGGYIEFGLDESYGARAPIEVNEDGHRTLLLGMRQASDYHYRILAQSGGDTCASEDAVLTTGTAPDGVPTVRVDTPYPDQVSPGFLITSTGGNNSGSIVIYDQSGELVWWYQPSIGGMSSVRVDWAGKFLYARDGNPGGGQGGQVVRVAMDGSTEEEVTVDTGHHDVAAIDDGMLFLTGGGADDCSQIHKLSSTDELSFFYDLRDAFGDDFSSNENDPCHCNSIRYNPIDDSVTVSCLGQNAYVKISTAGDLAWVLGGNGTQSHFTGDIEWNRQHGHHMIDENHILFFNNNGLSGDGGGQGASLAVELELDLDQKVATRIRAYDGGSSSQTLGDAQTLPNGNILVTYCNSGVIHEVNGSDELVQSMTFEDGTGYSNHRTTLYGAPPRP